MIYSRRNAGDFLKIVEGSRAPTGARLNVPG